MQVLDEVVGNRVVKNTADAILIIVERDKGFATPTLTENFGTFKGVGMRDTVYLLACSDTVSIIGVLDIVKLLELTPLFPSQSVPEVRGMILFYHLRLEKSISIKNSAPRKKCGEKYRFLWLC